MSRVELIIIIALLVGILGIPFFSFLVYQFAPDGIHLELEMIQVLITHGVRTPSRIEERVCNFSDSHSLTIWGYDQLTDVGMAQMYRLGLVLQPLYGHFLGNYSSEDVYARATHYNSTRDSLLMTLSGLYLPEMENPVWNEQLTSGPEFGIFRYELVEMKKDVLFETSNCASFRRKMTNYVTSPEFQQQVEKYNSTLEIIKEHGNNAPKLQDFSFANFVFDFIHSLKAMNDSVPPWCNDQIYSDLRELYLLGAKAETINPELKKIKAGPLLREFLINMNNTDHKKAYFYCARDSNIASIADTLHLDDFDYTEYGSAIIVETLHDVTNSSSKFVKLFHWRGFGNSVYALKMRDCDELCPKIAFDEVLSSYVPNDEELDELTKEMLEINPNHTKEYFFV